MGGPSLKRLLLWWIKHWVGTINTDGIFPCRRVHILQGGTMCESAVITPTGKRDRVQSKINAGNVLGLLLHEKWKSARAPTRAYSTAFMTCLGVLNVICPFCSVSFPFWYSLQDSLMMAALILPSSTWSQCICRRLTSVIRWEQIMLSLGSL